MYFNLCPKVELTCLFEFSKNGFSTLVTDSLVAPPVPVKVTLALYALTNNLGEEGKQGPTVSGH